MARKCCIIRTNRFGGKPHCGGLLREIIVTRDAHRVCNVCRLPFPTCGSLLNRMDCAGPCALGFAWTGPRGSVYGSWTRPLLWPCPLRRPPALYNFRTLFIFIIFKRAEIASREWRAYRTHRYPFVCSTCGKGAGDRWALRFPTKWCGFAVVRVLWNQT